MNRFAVLTIQTHYNHYDYAARHRDDVPRTADGTVLLDFCPRGTTDVRSFRTAKEAAVYMGRSVSTVHRQCREYREAIEEDALGVEPEEA